MAAPVPSLLAENVISARIVGFTDHLRMNDFKIGPSETHDVVKCLLDSPVLTLAQARLSLKILLSSRQDEWERFDDLFEAYWLAKGRQHTVSRTRIGGDGRDTPSGRRLWNNHFQSDAGPERSSPLGVEGAGQSDIDGDAQGRLIATERSTRVKTDLRYIVDPQEIAEAEQLAYRLATAMRYRLSRRYRQDHRGTRLDFRRTIRANLAHGGDPLSLVQKSKPDRPVRIVVFLDVSGSMKAYSRFFLQFLKGLVCAWINTDAYLFHTKLIRVTDAVRDKDSFKAMARLSLMADGFGGGTKLGASLCQFNDAYAKRALNSRSVVMILSDGYDTGSVEVLTRELARLKRRAPRLIWMNPLLGWRNYRPVTTAMDAAMPFIDHFAAANTLDALAAIEPELARL
ncbi:MAG: vWA domain-containing protein [Alphaproteobacteria bacterium]